MKFPGFFFLVHLHIHNPSSLSASLQPPLRSSSCPLTQPSTRPPLPLGTVAKQRRVSCRINREGGFSTPHLTLLLDPDNKAETAVTRRRLNRAAIQTEVSGRTR